MPSSDQLKNAGPSRFRLFPFFGWSCFKDAHTALRVAFDQLDSFRVRYQISAKVGFAGIATVVGLGYPSPPCRVSQVPRLICPCALSPTTPEGPTSSLLIASPPVSGFIIFGRLATSNLRHEAESGSLALRLAGSHPRFPPDRLLHLAPVPLHVRTSNLHGELLSVH